MIRRSLTPNPGIPAQSYPATRRAGGGARKEISARVKLINSSGSEIDGWALNISRGGLRVVTEGHLDLGEEIEVRDLDPDTSSPRYLARVVWMQDEVDGAVVGLQCLDVEIGKAIYEKLTSRGVAGGDPPASQRR